MFLCSRCSQWISIQVVYFLFGSDLELTRISISTHHEHLHIGLTWLWLAFGLYSEFHSFDILDVIKNDSVGMSGTSLIMIRGGAFLDRCICANAVWTVQEGKVNHTNDFKHRNLQICECGNVPWTPEAHIVRPCKAWNLTKMSAVHGY